MARLKGKVAIITGAGNGMGRATSILFGKEGACVAVTDVKETDGLETVRLVEAAGGKAKFWPLNVSKEREIESELAIVVDESGGLEGVVTRTDLLEAIAGDLPEQAGEEPEVRELPDGALSFDGALPVLDLQERLRLDALPEGSYYTAVGLVLAILGRLPERGDVVEWGGWKLEVAVMDGLGVGRIVARARGARSRRARAEC